MEMTQTDPTKAKSTETEEDDIPPLQVLFPLFPLPSGQGLSYLLDLDGLSIHSFHRTITLVCATEGG